MFPNRRIQYILSAFLVLFPFLPIAYSVWVVNGNVSFTDKSVSGSLSGTYTKWEHQDGRIEWSPSKPDSITVTASGTATGLGNGAVELASGSMNGKSIASSKDGDRIGQFGVLRHLPMIPIYTKGTKSFSASDSLSNLPLEEGTYFWDAIGKFYTQGVRFSGLTWNDKVENHTSKRGDGSWTIKHSKMCPGNPGEEVNDFDDHRVQCLDTATKGSKKFYWSCTQASDHANIVSDCGHIHRRCVPHTCGAGDDSGSGDGSGDGNTSTPTDNTPNCPDCTSDCSSPCSSNSGTCGGTVVDNTPDCSYCTDGCSACPPQIVACGGASYTGCSGASSRTEHHVPSCSSGCGNGYWTCSSTAVYDHEMPFTCRRCGTSFTRCSNGTCTTATGTYTYHWAQ